MRLFAYFLSGRLSEKNFSEAEKNAGCLVAIAMLLSGLEGNTLFSLRFFFTYCFAPQHVAEG